MRRMLGYVAALVAGLLAGYGFTAIKSQEAPTTGSPSIAVGLDLSREPGPVEASFYQKLEAAVIQDFGDGNRARLLPLLNSLTVEQLIRIAQHYIERPSQDTSHPILEVALKLWSDRSPQSFLRETRFHNYSQFVLPALKAIDAEEAVQLFSAFNLRSRKQFWNDFFEHLLDTSPEHALKLASRRDQANQLKALEKVFEQDPDIARTFVESMAEGSNKRQAQKILDGEPAPSGDHPDPRDEIQQLLADSPAKAAEALAKLRGHQQVDMLGMILLSFLSEDKEAALAWVDTLTSPEARAKAKREIILAEATGGLQLGTMPPPPPPPGQAPQSQANGIAATPEALAEHLKAFPEGLHGEIVTRLMNDRLQSDPKAAAALTLALPPGAHQSQALEFLMTRWPDKDPAAAAEFSHQLAPVPEYLKWFEAVGKHYAKADPQAALAWATELSHEGYRREALKAIVPELTRSQNPADILTQLQNLPDGHTQEAATNTLLNVWSDLNFTEASAVALANGHHTALKQMFRYASHSLDDAISAHQSIIDSSSVPSEDQIVITNTLAARIASTDTAQAISWSQDLPTGAVQETAFQQAVTEWAQVDATAASRFVSDFNGPHLKDHAAAGLAAGTVNMDQEASFQWALTITDAALRDQTMEQVITKWRSSNPEALRAALESASTITAGERTKWLEKAR